MNPLRQWTASLSRTRFLAVAGLAAGGALWLNATSRSRVWAYDEAITPAAVRQERADLERRLRREARVDSSAQRMTARRATADSLLRSRHAHLRRVATLLHAAELASWGVLLLVGYLVWARAASRRPGREGN